MKPLPPSAGDLDALAARRAQRRLDDKARRARLQAGLRVVFLVFAGLALVALVADLRNFGRRAAARPAVASGPRPGAAADILAGLDDPRYEDPRGYFSFVPPRGWIRPARPPAGFYDVVFQGPHGMDLAIQVVATNQTFNQLVDKLRQVERSLAADTHMDFAYVGPHRAVKRSVQLFRSRVLVLDFLTGDLAHHVQFSTPPELYEEYEPVFLRLMQTYSPGRLVTAGDPPAAP
jgi:hypothetical protein